MTWSEWRAALVDFAIPVASILIPTAIAIWLARRERQAASKERAVELDRLRDERQAIEVRQQAEARRRAIEAALTSMSDLVRAAFIVDPVEEAAVRIGSAARIAAIRLDLMPEEDPVFSWITRELGVVGLALNDRTPAPVRLPVHGEQISWRAGNFASALTDWIVGETSVQWFSDAPNIPIEDTTKPGGHDE